LNARLGRPAEAATYFERVTKLAPTFVPAQQALERARAEAVKSLAPPDLKSAR
jgi:cytochrome c-type biogenesis protein CcmH/NrfG